jgi:peptidoglycan-associated lipoprotein
MRLNKTVKALAVVLPIMALSACSSNDTVSEDTSAMQKNETAMAEQKARDAAERVKVAAMQRAEEIKAQQQQEIDRLRS